MPAPWRMCKQAASPTWRTLVAAFSARWRRDGLRILIGLPDKLRPLKRAKAREQVLRAFDDDGASFRGFPTLAQKRRVKVKVPPLALIYLRSQAAITRRRLPQLWSGPRSNRGRPP